MPLTFSKTINHGLLFLGVTSRERRQWTVGRHGREEVYKELTTDGLPERNVRVEMENDEGEGREERIGKEEKEEGSGEREEHGGLRWRAC